MIIEVCKNTSMETSTLCQGGLVARFFPRRCANSTECRASRGAHLCVADDAHDGAVLVGLHLLVAGLYVLQVLLHGADAAAGAEGAIPVARPPAPVRLQQQQALVHLLGAAGAVLLFQACRAQVRLPRLKHTLTYGGRLGEDMRLIQSARWGSV